MASPLTAPFAAGSFPVGATSASVLAHQGGWDEALLVATPLAVIGLLLMLANRRVKAQLAEQEAAAARDAIAAGEDTAAGEDAAAGEETAAGRPGSVPPGGKPPEA